MFARAIERFPESPYVPMMAHDFAMNPVVPAERRFFFGDRAAEALGRYYQRTSGYRPGFRRIPAIGGPGAVQKEIIPEGVQVTLQPGGEIWLDALNTWGSDRFKLALYAKVASGAATLCIATPKGCRTDAIPIVDTPFPYRVIETGELAGEETTAIVVLRAGDHGAVVILRDLHPLVENPRFY